MSDQLTSGGVSLSAEQQFDQAYRAAQPPEVRALMDMPADSPDAISARIARGAALAAKGYTIDAPIMIYAWDPYLCMTERLNAGMVWVPSALQPGLGMPGQFSSPGLDTPGTLGPYPATPPPGSIKVSVNLADYPPFDVPAPPPPPTAQSPVGPQSLGTLYLSNALGNTYPDGSMFTEARGTFLKHVSITPFGRSNYWEKIA
ncbi:MAG TPA: hypothetical protein VKX49_12510 [Bryobacteraceae bacterium]|nr:hypothetical protein [Bryobacteraceae bacterium]